MNLAQRLALLEKQKPTDLIKLGLDRVKNMALSLNLLSIKPKVIMVAGTNGKGSTIATLEQLLLSHNKRVATYTSPHLYKFNERIRLNGAMVSDQQILNAFDTLEQHSDSHQLTYYEWVTLAALLIFKTESLDYILLEVGLGGRLDAVNIIDADIALITSIDFDHTDLLGETLEEIAFEKAGIFRDRQKVFCAEVRAPNSLMVQADKHQVDFQQLQVDFNYKVNNKHWDFIKGDLVIKELPLIYLHINNVCNALSCFTSLKIAYTRKSVQDSLKQINLSGRCQKKEGDHPMLLDVAHNGQAISNLCLALSKLKRPVIMVFSMLQGKNIESNINLLAPYVKQWFIAPLNSPRSYSMNELKEFFINKDHRTFNSIEKAFIEARARQEMHQTLVVCGSFLTVAQVINMKAI